MSEPVVVNLSPERLEVAPGESVATTATVRNASDVVEAYSISVEGIDPQWCTLSKTSLHLFPGAQDQVQITIQPPRTSASKAGAYDAIVRVASTSDVRTIIMAAAPLALEVKQFVQFDLSLSPKSARGRKGSYRLGIINQGNAATTYSLTGEDPDEICRFDFARQAARVERGTTAEVPVVVNPKKKPFTGRAKSYHFKVTAAPPASDGGEPKTVEGQLECRPLLPKWALGLAALALAGIIAIVVIFAFGGGDTGSSGSTGGAGSTDGGGSTGGVTIEGIDRWDLQDNLINPWEGREFELRTPGP